VTQHFESCWRSSTENRAQKSLKESDLTKLKRDSSFDTLWEQTQEEVRTGRSFRTGKSSRRRIDGQDSQKRIAKSRRSSDQGEAAQGLFLRCRKNPKPSYIGISRFSLWRLTS
jgi:hypothetical protein